MWFRWAKEDMRLSLMGLTLALIGALVVGLGVRTHEASARRAGCSDPQQVVREGNWTAIRAPLRGEQPYLNTYAVHPRNPRVIFVAHDDEIFRTANGGCDWESVYKRERSVPESDIHLVDSSLNPGISRLVIAKAAPDHVYSLWKRPVEQGWALTLVVSRDGGREWEMIDPGIITSAITDSFTLHPAPSDAETIYLSVTRQAVPGQAVPGAEEDRSALHVSNDGGYSWELVYPETSHTARQASDGDPVSWTELAVDPLKPEVVWILGKRLRVHNVRPDYPGGVYYLWQGVYRSTDGGGTWERLDPWARKHITHVRLKGIDLFRAAGGYARVAITGTWREVRDGTHYGPFHTNVVWSEDGGLTWSFLPAPAPGHIAEEVVHGRTPKEIVVRVDVTNLVFRWDHQTGRWVDLRVPRTPSDRITHLVADHRKRPTYYAYRAGTGHLLKHTLGGR